MGKASVSNITVSLSLVVAQKPWLWPVSRLWALWLAHSRSFPSPPPGSVRWHRYCPISAPWLAPYRSPSVGTLLLHSRWHPTANHQLASSLPGGSPRLLPFRSVGPSSVTPSPGIALPPWLLSNTLDRCNNLPDRTTWFWWPLNVWVFLYRRSSIPSPRPAFLAVRVFCFVLVSLLKGLGLSTCTCLCFVSLRVWGFIILGARWGGLFLWTRGVWFFPWSGEAGRGTCL